MTAPVVPVTGITPIYGMEYLVEGEPAFHLRQKWQRTVQAIEAALAAEGMAPPGGADLAAVSGRVSALEFDTGWVPITMNTPIETVAATSAVRRIGRTVELTLTGAWTGVWTAGYVIAQLPAGQGFYPTSKPRWRPGMFYGGAASFTSLIGTNGAVSLPDGSAGVSRTGVTLGATWTV